MHRDVDKKIEDLISKTKGNYITQGVAFNITCPRQMAMLKLALEDSASFSGLVKEMLALRYSTSTQPVPHNAPIVQPQDVQMDRVTSIKKVVEKVETEVPEEPKYQAPLDKEGGVDERKEMMNQWLE